MLNQQRNGLYKVCIQLPSFLQIRASDRSILTAVLIAAFGICSVCTPSAKAVPADIRQRIEATAQSWRTTENQLRQIRQLSGDPHMAAVARQVNRNVTASLITQTVMEAIFRNPADAQGAMAIAVKTAPELGPAITQQLRLAFPALLQTVARPRQMTTPPLRLGAMPRAPPQTKTNEADFAATEVLDYSEYRDPLEGFNRVMFAFNDLLDSYLMVPIAYVYRLIMPAPLRTMGRNFFENFKEPVVAINDLLQRDLKNAGTSVGRFVINSTIGLFGFFEVAELVGLEEHPADFGQTLHSYGVGHGPYIVLPFLGPSTARDAIGGGVDSFLSPMTYVLDFENRMYLKASEIVVYREQVLDPLKELREGSLDYYAAVRAAWFQKREKELRRGRPPKTKDVDKLFSDVK